MLAAMAAEVHHPLFARCFDRLSHALERELGRHRTELLVGLRGRVLELGAGNGINFGHYPAGVDEVVAVEPEPYLRARARAAAGAAPVRVSVEPGVGERLPFPDASFDGAVASLVLCTVADQAAALRELRRVLRPGGELRFFEHVRARGGPMVNVQRIADASGIWPLLAGGCHCSRSTAEAIAAAGFAVRRIRYLHIGPRWALVNPHVLGCAERESSPNPGP